MFFNKLRSSAEENKLASSLYQSIVKQARDVRFYTSYGVPDSLEGRYEMIVLHMFLFLHNLKAVPEVDEEIGKYVTEEFFSELDGSLREMGVGDITVPKKMRKLADSFYGRLYAYKDAVDKNDKGALSEALERNIYSHLNEAAASNNEISENSDSLSAYVLATNKIMLEDIQQSLLSGNLKFQ